MFNMLCFWPNLEQIQIHEQRTHIYPINILKEMVSFQLCPNFLERLLAIWAIWLLRSRFFNLSFDRDLYLRVTCYIQHYKTIPKHSEMHVCIM